VLEIDYLLASYRFCFLRYHVSALLLDDFIKAEKEIDVNYTLHRPVGRINIMISRGKHIRSRDLGLAGNVCTRVYWDPLRYSNDKQKEKILAIDKSAATTHDIGLTDSKFTTSPKWDKFHESEESRRLKQVLPHHGHFFETDEEIGHKSAFEFPVLQPFRRLDDDDEKQLNLTLEPWKASPGGLVFQVSFRDILNMLPGSDHIFGEVSIPFSTLVEKGELSGWFQVLDVGTKEFVIVNEPLSTGVSDIVDDSSVISGLAEVALSNTSDTPQIFLTIKWSPPEKPADNSEAQETDREASLVIQEELQRWAVINSDKDKLKKLVVGGSIGAFKTVSGLTGTVQIIQNFLGKIANTIEAIRNLLNFTVSPPDPRAVLFIRVRILRSSSSFFT
jgi:hypothetical protein